MKTISVLIYFFSLFFIVVDKLPAEISPNGKNRIGVYFPYNYRTVVNDTNWVDTTFVGDGKKHNLEMLGIGVKYSLNNRLLLDISQKSLIMGYRIGDTTRILNGEKLYLGISMLNSYVLSLNYVQDISNKINLFAGIGRVFNRIQFKRNLDSFSEGTFNMYFNTWVLKFGGEYKLNERLCFNLSFGFEEAVKLRHTTYDGKKFQYNYKSPYFIEPAITLYF